MSMCQHDPATTFVALFGALVLLRAVWRELRARLWPRAMKGGDAASNPK